jgi:hypothetical protein
VQGAADIAPPPRVNNFACTANKLHFFIAGLATLLNAGHVHRTKYHALSLQLRRICPGGGGNSCADPDVEFTQTLTLVTDPNIIPENADTNRPVSWSIRSLFGIGLTSTCPMAETSNIYVDVTRDSIHQITF